jgi:hypothetical protein
MLYQILQRVLAQLETQRATFAADIPSLVERSVAAHLNSPSPNALSPAIPVCQATAIPVSAAATSDFWSQQQHPAHSPVNSTHQFSPYGAPQGGSPMMMAYDISQQQQQHHHHQQQQQQPARLQVPSTMATGMPNSAGSASPYDAAYTWPSPQMPEQEGLWFNEEESRLLSSFGAVSRA